MNALKHAQMECFKRVIHANHAMRNARLALESVVISVIHVHQIYFMFNNIKHACITVLQNFMQISLIKNAKNAVWDALNVLGHSIKNA